MVWTHHWSQSVNDAGMRFYCRPCQMSDPAKAEQKSKGWMLCTGKRKHRQPSPSPWPEKNNDDCCSHRILWQLPLKKTGARASRVLLLLKRYLSTPSIIFPTVSWAVPEVHADWRWLYQEKLLNKYPSTFNCCLLFNNLLWIWMHFVHASILCSKWTIEVLEYRNPPNRKRENLPRCSGRNTRQLI